MLIRVTEPLELIIENFEQNFFMFFIWLSLWSQGPRLTIFISIYICFEKFPKNSPWKCEFRKHYHLCSVNFVTKSQKINEIREFAGSKLKLRNIFYPADESCCAMSYWCLFRVQNFEIVIFQFFKYQKVTWKTVYVPYKQHLRSNSLLNYVVVLIDENGNQTNSCFTRQTSS